MGLNINILSQLVKSINPNHQYEYEFNEVKSIKSGKDWIGTFISSKNSISNEDGLKLVEHFKTPEKETVTKFKQEKIL